MNGIMTASSHTNFYNQDLVGSNSSPNSNSNSNPTSNSNSNSASNPNSNSDHNITTIPSSTSASTNQHHQLHQQPSQPHLPSNNNIHQIQLQLQPSPQQPIQQQPHQDIPPTYQQFSASNSYQQTRGVPKNYLMENTNYYTLQPGFPLIQQVDCYGNAGNGSSNNTTATGNNTNTSSTAIASATSNDYQNSLNSIISPSFQISSISTPDSQNVNLRTKQSHMHPYQQQQQQQQQINHQQMLSQQHQQVQELFNPQQTGICSTNYIPIKQQQQQKSFSSKSDQSTNDKLQQEISEQNQQVYNNPAFMFYSSQGGNSISAPISTTSSSGSATIPMTTNQHQQQQMSQNAGQFQFSYGSPPIQATTINTANQMYPLQSRQQQQQQQPQITATGLPMNIKSSSGINLANGVNKSRTSSISRSQAGGRQSRAASISSCIPQTEFPDRVVRPKVATTRWDDENTNCYQVRARNILVSRREDTNYINGTKLLNVIGMTRGKRDGILKTEKIKNVVKVGSMNLKGVWIPFDRAYEIARNEGVDGLLYPLFVKDIKEYFLTKGHKLKSEEDEQQQQQQQQQHNIDEDDEDDDDESTSISSSKNSESKLLESNEIIKNIEQGNIESANNPTSGTGDVSTTAATSAGTSASGDVKYVHEYFERSPQSTTLKEEELYYGSTQNTPLSVPKTL